MTSVKFEDLDVQRYKNLLPKRLTGLNGSKEESWIVKSGYDGPKLLTQLSIVIDMHEQIIVWFLPFDLSPKRQVRTC
jgi:hypothetical protein